MPIPCHTGYSELDVLTDNILIWSHYPKLGSNSYSPINIKNLGKSMTNS